ncbi:hypothetical protein H2203_000186 [Taxawa tesnikishii (nom. ined.)]|nr:hypothetical protein H2203_000186 [Dothideales sp. JES 119]
MHIRLRLLPDIQSLDVNEESVIWVAVEAEATTTSPTADRQIGEIRKLKLSVRPETGVLLDVVGQRTISSLSAGQRLEMFLKVNILRKQNLSCSQSTTKLMDTLTAELERELGYGSTALFTVTARYRHSLLPEDTILMVRHHCKIRRPNRDSMWSLPGDEAPTDGVTYNGQKHLIDFLIRNNPRTWRCRQSIRGGLQFFCTSPLAFNLSSNYHTCNQFHKYVLHRSINTAILSLIISSRTFFQSPLPFSDVFMRITTAHRPLVRVAARSAATVLAFPDLVHGAFRRSDNTGDPHATFGSRRSPTDMETHAQPQP